MHWLFILGPLVSVLLISTYGRVPSKKARSAVAAIVFLILIGMIFTNESIN